MKFCSCNNSINFKLLIPTSHNLEGIIGVRDNSSPKPVNVYTEPDGNPIEEKSHLRDLGVQVSSDLSFSIHIENVVSASTQMVGWIQTNHDDPLEAHDSDYCYQLWSPKDQTSISKLEGVARTNPLS